MKFNRLHEHIPLARYGKAKSLTMEPYPGIILAMPGRHAEDTTPKGGDFVVMVTDDKVGWKKHQFTHDDIFRDIELKATDDSVMSPTTKMNARELTHLLMEAYLEVIALGVDPAKVKNVEFNYLPGLRPGIFLAAVQCLGVAEHRRYHKYEEKFGGRFLPFRFAAGIAEGLWTADEAIEKQKYGRPAVERLEKQKGVPTLSQMLMDATP